MNVAILQAMVIATGGLSSLGAVLIVLLLLNREAGPGSAFAFGLGYFGGYTTIASAGVFFGAGLFEARGADASPSWVVSALLCLLGALLLAAAVKQWRTPPSQEPPAFLETVDQFAPVKALGVGLLIPLINFKNLAIYLPAVAVLVAAELSLVERLVGVLAIATVFCGAMLTPLAIYVLLPRRAARWLAGLRRWVEANSHKVARVILPVIGTLLLAKGGHGLWTLIQ